MSDATPASKRNARPLLGIVVLYALVCLIWGSNWIAIDFAVTDMPPMLAAGLRFLVAAPVLIGLCLVMRVPLKFPPDLRRFAIFVTFGYFLVPFLLFNTAEVYISSGLTAICFSTVSVMIVLLSVPVLKTRVQIRQIVGVVIAFLALALLVTRLDEVSAENSWGVVAALCAALMHSYAYVLIKKHGGPVHVLTLNTVPMALAGVLLVAVSLVVNRPGPEVFTAGSVIATVHLALVASVIGLVVYFWLLQRLSAVTMSFVFVIFPVIAQLFSVTFEGIRLDAVDLLLTGVIVAAFAWTQLSGRATRRAAPPAGEPAAVAGEPAAVPADATAQALPTPEQLRQIYAHAARAYPHEACGFVRGSGVRECPNVIEEMNGATEFVSDRTARTGYAFAAKDLLELVRSFDSDDPVLLVYHSHPDVGAYFSAEDQRHAVVDGEPVYPVDHLVVDATATGVQGSRRYRFDERNRRYAELASYGNPGSGNGSAGPFESREFAELDGRKDNE